MEWSLIYNLESLTAMSSTKEKWESRLEHVFKNFFTQSPKMEPIDETGRGLDSEEVFTYINCDEKEHGVSFNHASLVNLLNPDDRGDVK